MGSRYDSVDPAGLSARRRRMAPRPCPFRRPGGGCCHRRRRARGGRLMETCRAMSPRPRNVGAGPACRPGRPTAGRMPHGGEGTRLPRDRRRQGVAPGLRREGHGRGAVRRRGRERGGRNRPGPREGRGGRAGRRRPEARHRRARRGQGAGRGHGGGLPAGPRDEAGQGHVPPPALP